MPIRRVSTPEMYRSSEYYDRSHSYLQGYSIDWERMSAAQSRQSTKGADYNNVESRMNQEGMFDTAGEMRPDHNIDMVLELDEGAGVSGQKKIYQRPKLKTGWDYLINHLLGTWFVAREDRLFRDRHGTQSSAFTEECQKHNCILIIPGKRCYDFSRDDDLAIFKKKMDEAAAYLKHVRYMNDMQLKKQERGEWIGGGLIAPYVLDRVALMRMKEYIKHQRLLGLRASDMEITLEMSQASRPVIYQPWLERSLDLFEKIKLFNFEIPRLMRYIEEKPYLFPFPTADDRMRYLFKVNSKRVDGGYTFVKPESVKKWLTNPQHIGWMIAGKDEESEEHIYLEDCFQGVIACDEFEETYIELMGEDLDGNQIERVRSKARFTRAAPTRKSDALLLGCFKSDYRVTSEGGGTASNNWYYRCMTKPYQAGTASEKTYRVYGIWTLPINPFDREIVNRLASLANYDKDLAERIRSHFAEQKKGKATNKKLITDDITKLQKKYAHLQWLKTNEELGQTEQQIKEIVKDQQEILRQIDIAKIELEKINVQHPSTAVPRFYDVLGHIPEEFWKQDIDHRRRMLRLLIDNIQVENISTHVYTLCVNWIAPVSTRADAALLYRWSSHRVEWTPEEKEKLRDHYEYEKREDILQLFPDCSWSMIIAQAHRIGIKRKRLIGVPCNCPFHTDISYNDWIKTCAYYEIDPESEEGQEILHALNTYATQATHKEIDFLWLLPAERMSVRTLLEGSEGDPLTYVLEATRASPAGALMSRWVPFGAELMTC